MPIRSILWTALLLAAPALAADTVFHVAPTGRDDNPGTKEKPFATLEAARAAVRQAGRQVGKKPAEVILHAGVYARNASFALDASDSGTTYRAAPGEAVSLRGSVPIPAKALAPVKDDADRQRLPAEARDHVLVADLKALGVNDYGDPVDIGHRPELFAGDTPLTLARWPNEGFVKIAEVGKAKPVTLRLPGGREKRWAPEAATMRLFGYWFHDWADAYQAVAGIDDAGIVTLAAPFHHYGYRKNQRVYALNLLCELDAPGEWYLDRAAGRLYVYPPAGEAADLSLSILERPLVELKDASDVRLEGLTLERTRGPAVAVAGGKGCTLARCVIRNTGDRGADIRGGAAHGLADCEVYRTGRGGVLLDGGDRPTLKPAGHFVTDCEFRDFSRLKRTYAPAVQANGVGQRVAHNLIHNAPHMAIGFAGNDHLFEYNEIHDVCRETGDVGVFYTGRDWTFQGNVIRFNFIHHVKGPGTYGAQGVYIDDAAGGMHIHGNIFYQVQRAIQMGGGRDNVIEDNLIVECPRSLDFDNRGLGWMKDKTGGNGVMRKRLAEIPYTTPPWSTRYGHLVNILKEDPGSPRGNTIRRNVLLDSGAMSLAAEVTKFGSISANLTTKDPLGLANVKALDFRLPPDAPLLHKLPGFHPIPFAQIGRHRGKD